MTAPAKTTAPSPHPGMGFPQFVVLMAALMALSAMGIDAMLPALPQIARGFHVAQANQQQLVVTVFLLSFGAAQLFFGRSTSAMFTGMPSKASILKPHQSAHSAPKTPSAASLSASL